ncbi:hypothetical protein ACWDUB_33935, partial [Streptomyces fungicidicus]
MAVLGLARITPAARGAGRGRASHCGRPPPPRPLRAVADHPDGEFDAVLDEIVEIAADFAPDLIVHSGD